MKTDESSQFDKLIKHETIVARPQFIQFPREPLPEGKEFIGNCDDQGLRHGVWVLDGDECDQLIELHFENGKLEGIETETHANGQKALEIPWAQNTVHGTVRQWDEEGNLFKEVEFASGELNGKVTTWYENGQKTIWNYQFGELHGQSIEYDSEGNEKFNHRFVHGVWVEPEFANLTNLLNRRQLTVLLSFLGFAIFAWIREPFVFYLMLMLFVSVSVHELGHWLIARLIGIPATHFVVGIGPQLCSFVFMRTIVTINALPILGYVLPATMRKSEYSRYLAWKKGMSDKDWPDVDKFERPILTTYFVNRASQVLFYLGGVLVNFLLAVLVIWIARYPSDPVAAINKTSAITVSVWTTIPTVLSAQFSWDAISPGQSGGLAAMKDSVDLGDSESTSKTVQEYDKQTQTYKVVIQSKVSPWILFAFINIVFVSFNLLPIPPLDGFRCAIVAVEACMRRPVPTRFLYFMNVLGLVIVGSLCLVAIYDMIKGIIYLMLE